MLTFARDGSFSINIKLPGSRMPEIIPNWQNYDPEIETKKVVLFLKALMSIEFLEETIIR